MLLWHVDLFVVPVYISFGWLFVRQMCLVDLKILLVAAYTIGSY